MLEYTEILKEKKNLEKICEDEQKQFYITLKSIRREKELIREEEIVDVCRRLINIKETVVKFQETDFPGYMEC